MLLVARSSAIQRNQHPRHRFLTGLLICLLLLGATGLGSWSFNRRAAAADPPSGDVIVVLKDDQVAAATTSRSRTAAVTPTHVYTNVINGFSATVTQEQADALANDPAVAAIVPDRPIHAAAQTIPDNIKRVGANQNSTARIDGADQRVNADIAVLDTGVDTSHPDLNVVGGTDCVVGNGNPGATFTDRNGHGTHVAGIAAAIDNGSGVVGVAPGAKIWSVRVLDSTASGSEGTLICGLDWVAAHSSTIDVVNMSVEGGGADSTCFSTSSPDPLHDAICKVVNKKIPVVVAAGNDTKTTTNVIPATYPEVITVSAFTDTDGIAGGSGPGCPNFGSDDRFAPYSNFGADVDIAAPGSCVLSTTLGGGTGEKTGTSMATPHVTGAIALFKSANPGASIASIRNWLFTIAASSQSSGRGFKGDPDSTHEPVLWLGPAGNPRAVLSPTNGTVNSYISGTVTDFPPHTNVWLRWDGNLIGKYPVNSAGDANFVFQAPASPIGQHAVRMAAGDVAIVIPYRIKPRIKLIPDSGKRGATINVSLRGYAAHESVRIRWLHGSSWVELKRVMTSSTGSANVDVKVPSWAAIGSQKVRGDGSVARAQTNAFDVTGGAAATTKSPTPTPSPTSTVPEGSPEASPVPSETVPSEIVTETPVVNETATTEAPTEEPTDTPTETPTDTPTDVPTETPTELPTETPCIPPTVAALLPASVQQTAGAPSSAIIFDQNPGSAWLATPPETDQDPAQIVVNLGAPQTIDKLRWVVTDPNAAAGMVISVSNDGANWQTVAAPADVTPGDWRELTLGSAWQFIRFQFPNPNGAAQVGGLAEVEILPPLIDTCA